MAPRIPNGLRRHLRKQRVASQAASGRRKRVQASKASPERAPRQVARRSAPQDDREVLGKPKVSPSGLFDAFSAGRDRWVNTDGKPPQLDKDGRLQKDFVTALHDEAGNVLKVERWGVGSKLPTPPGILEQEAAERERKRGPVKVAAELDGHTAFKVTRTGKRKRKTDAELTPQQLKRRQYNIKRNAEKKRRKSA